MSTRIDYSQLADKLDYPTVEKKLKQLAERKPTRKRKTAADVLEPLREQLLDLHRKGWSSSQLVNELKASGVPVSPARFRECLSRWANDGKSRPSRRKNPGSVTAQPSAPASQDLRSKSTSAAGQPGFKLTQP